MPVVKKIRIEILEFKITDYDAVFSLWQSCEGVALSEADSFENIQSYLRRNPGMSFVARADGTLVGALLAGHDGRRGYMHHLAVDAGTRRQGIGGRLVEACLEALKKSGMKRCHIFIFNTNVSGQAFWKRLGWDLRRDIGIISKDIV